MSVIIIAAVDVNYGLGKNNDLLFKIPEDMKRFKDLTTHNAVIMGRKTWESIGSKPLPNRKNIVVARNKINHDDSVSVYKDFESAVIDSKFNYPNKDIYIIGGGQIYEQSLKFADKILLTVLNKEYEGVDTYFPSLADTGFVCTETESGGTFENCEFKFVEFRKCNISNVEDEE